MKNEEKIYHSLKVILYSLISKPPPPHAFPTIFCFYSGVLNGNYKFFLFFLSRFLFFHRFGGIHGYFVRKGRVCRKSDRDDVMDKNPSLII